MTCALCGTRISEDDLIECEECGEMGCSDCIEDGVCYICQEERDQEDE